MGPRSHCHVPLCPSLLDVYCTYVDIYSEADLELTSRKLQMYCSYPHLPGFCLLFGIPLYFNGHFVFSFIFFSNIKTCGTLGEASSWCRDFVSLAVFFIWLEQVVTCLFICLVEEIWLLPQYSSCHIYDMFLSKPTLILSFRTQDFSWLLCIYPM